MIRAMHARNKNIEKMHEQEQYGSAARLGTLIKQHSRPTNMNKALKQMAG